MSVCQNDQTLYLNWLEWWHSGFFLNSDPDWHKQSRLFSLSGEQLRKFLRQNASILPTMLALSEQGPSDPQPLILNITQLNSDQRCLLLDLVAEICGCPTKLSSEHKIWCRRLAKGMRPQTWLPETFSQHGGKANSLLLLNALIPDIWSRAKFLFPRRAVEELNTLPSLALSASRLRPLWEAALWRCQPKKVREEYVESEEN